MHQIPDNSVDLVMTSPPYPMIEMWDEFFSSQNSDIKVALSGKEGFPAFELMHRELESVWNEVHRILVNGGIACINIGDATRTIDGHFMLYPNHSKTLTYMLNIGFAALPAILWRKQTNAPSKFMGSGMLPPGAYVTQEHEYILILRKGHKKTFHTAGEKKRRRESAFFWEERNVWYSDVWTDLKGISQTLGGEVERLRSGAYPFEVPYRLINMFSVKGDTVVDPFLGTGTTLFAAMAASRNSFGFELEPGFRKPILSLMNTIVEFSNAKIQSRLKNHTAFVEDRFKRRKGLKYINQHYQFPVMSRQETELLLNPLDAVKIIGDNAFEVTYSRKPQQEFCKDWTEFIVQKEKKSVSKEKPFKKQGKESQLKLLE
ncbi:DNA-methyltransferase [Thermodesulfobacteriota bacterium]